MKLLTLSWRAARILLMIVAALILATAASAQTNYDCQNNYISGTITASGATQLLVAPTNQTIRICQVTIQIVQGTTAANFGLVYGTGANCATGQGNISPAWSGYAGAVQFYSRVIPSGSRLLVPYNNGLCLNLSAAPVSVQVEILYAIN